MFRFGFMLATAALLLSADVPGAVYLRSPVTERVEIPSSENLPVFPDMPPSNGQPQSGPEHSPSASSDKPPAKSKDQPLQPESRLALVRFVDGEFARVVAPIPAGKNGIHLKAGVPLDEQQLRITVGSSGAAINPGDKAQVTSLEFKDREIVVDINGGGRGKKKLRDRIHMEVGGIPTMTSSGPENPVETNVGATIFSGF